MKRRHLSCLAAVGLAVLVYGPAPALAQGYLGANLIPYAVLGGTDVTCTGGSAITGDVGVSPGTSITGFPGLCPNPTGGTLRVPPASDAGQADLLTAYGTLSALGCSSTVGPDLAGLTLVPGVYCVSGAPSNLTGTLTLNAQGNPNAVWVFRMSSSLITSSGSNVIFSNASGANACGVQWQVSSSATIASGTTFVGNILALTSVFVQSGASLTGRALALNGEVTLDGNTVSAAACSASAAPPPFPGPTPTPTPSPSPSPSPTPTPVPTLPEIGAWALLVLLLGSGAYLLSRRTPTDASR